MSFEEATYCSGRHMGTVMKLSSPLMDDSDSGGL